VKLAADGGTAVFLVYMLCHHSLIAAIVIGSIPPVAASLTLMRYANLEPLKQSSFGRYLARYMTFLAMAQRLAGLVGILIGASFHLVWLIAVGLAVVVAAWIYGLFFPRWGTTDAA